MDEMFWYVNEDGWAYDSPLSLDEQTDAFPGDFHIQFQTKEQAEAFADSLDTSEGDDIKELLNKILNDAVQNDICTDSEADAISQRFSYLAS